MLCVEVSERIVKTDLGKVPINHLQVGMDGWTCEDTVMAFTLGRMNFELAVGLGMG